MKHYKVDWKFREIKKVKAADDVKLKIDTSLNTSQNIFSPDQINWKVKKNLYKNITDNSISTTQKPIQMSESIPLSSNKNSYDTENPKSLTKNPSYNPCQDLPERPLSRINFNKKKVNRKI